MLAYPAQDPKKAGRAAAAVRHRHGAASPAVGAGSELTDGTGRPAQQAPGAAMATAPGVTLSPQP